MNKQVLDEYLRLINLLKTCPPGQASEILQDNEELIDNEFVQKMREEADLLRLSGQQNPASYFHKLANYLTLRLKAYPFSQFLLEILEKVHKAKGDREIIYGMLTENIEKISEDFPQLLNEWAKNQLSDFSEEQVRSIAQTLIDFSELIQEFPQGIKVNNQEIAIACYKIGLKVYTFDMFPEDWSVIKNSLGIAYCNRIMGDRLENLEMAITAFQESLQVIDFTSYPEKWAKSYNNLGNAYRQLGLIDKAIETFEYLLRFYTINNFPKEWATLQNNLGITYTEKGNLEKAIQALISALQVRAFESFPEEWAASQNNLGIAYGKKGENDNAIAAFEKALRVYTYEKFPEYWAQTICSLGDFYQAKGNSDKAIKCFKSVLKKVFTPQNFPIESFDSGRKLGNIAFKIERWAEAIEGYEIAVEAVERSREWANLDARKQIILSEAIDVYAKMVHLYVNANKPDKAIEYIERSKTRNLVETLHERDIYPKGNIPQTVINQLKQMRQEIVAEQRSLDIIENKQLGNVIYDTDDLLTRNVAGQLKDRTKLDELLQNLDNLITKEIEPIDPSFRATQQAKSISYSEIKALVDDSTAIIEWYITSDKFYTFTISKQFEHPLVWSCSFEEKQAFIDEYLQDYQLNRKSWIEKLPERLQRLSQILHISEIINSLPSDYDQVILVPHQFLHLIPLHALPLSENNCLLNHFSGGVRYAPSCQLLQLTQNKRHFDFNRLLAFQNPTQDLGYADVEVLTIENLFPHADVFVEDNATKAAILQVTIKDNGTREVIQSSQLSLANCAHFSCHAEFNFESPLESALLLANGEYLTLGEIFDLDLSQCRLVTLSACETGLTNYKILSDEYVGISSSFLYAGSSSVVSSLWTVQDLSTAFLMIKFYQNLLANSTVRLALNKAQLWLRNITKKELEI